MIYRETIAIPQTEARGMQTLLDAHKPLPISDEYDKYGKIYEIRCGDNYLVHVNVTIEEDGPVVDAALFFKQKFFNRKRSWEEVASTADEHRRTLLGEYRFEHGGNEFLISVVEVPDLPPRKTRRRRVEA